MPLQTPDESARPARSAKPALDPIVLGLAQLAVLLQLRDPNRRDLQTDYDALMLALRFYLDAVNFLGPDSEKRVAGMQRMIYRKRGKERPGAWKP
jgi:hypothetical protein